jgi:hypothetical protein
VAKGKADPDHLLAPEQFPELNQAFYTTKPWEYFNYRNHLLILAAGAGDRLEQIAEEGVSYKGLTYKEGLDQDAADEVQAQVTRENFVIAESEALLHHTSETVLRLYLAHEPLKPCPWLEMARVRSPGDFKQMLEARFLKDLAPEERRERVAQVFYGSADRSNMTPTPTQDAWNKGLDNVEAYLVHFAQHFTDADLYNALKHGLAVRPGDAATQLDDGELLKAEGPAIEYLSLRRNSGDQRRWHRSTTWVRPDHSMGLVYLAGRLMESLWSIARFRYLNERPEAVNPWRTPLYEDVTRRLAQGEDAGVFIDSMHMELLYYIDPESEEPPRRDAA